MNMGRRKHGTIFYYLPGNAKDKHPEVRIIGPDQNL
jgi:hypothetical protein